MASRCVLFRQENNLVEFFSLDHDRIGRLRQHK